MLKNKPDYYNSLDKTYLKIWNLLNIGLLDRNDPFHIPVFACEKNGICDARIVVLRGLNRKNKTLWFHSDIRSNKIKILKENANVSLLFYNKNEKIQLRILGQAKINHQNETNLHNTSSVFNELPRNLLLIWCSLSFIFVKITLTGTITLTILLITIVNILLS